MNEILVSVQECDEWLARLRDTLAIANSTERRKVLDEIDFWLERRHEAASGT